MISPPLMSTGSASGPARTARGFEGGAMRLADFDALTFDCYGTLIDWEQGILTELGKWAAPKGLSDDAILEAFGTEESRCEAATPDKPYPGILADVFRALGRRWGLP